MLPVGKLSLIGTKKFSIPGKRDKLTQKYLEERAKRTLTELNIDLDFEAELKRIRLERFLVQENDSKSK